MEGLEFGVVDDLQQVRPGRERPKGEGDEGREGEGEEDGAEHGRGLLGDVVEEVGGPIACPLLDAVADHVADPLLDLMHDHVLGLLDRAGFDDEPGDDLERAGPSADVFAVALGAVVLDGLGDDVEAFREGREALVGRRLGRAAGGPLGDQAVEVFAGILEGRRGGHVSGAGVLVTIDEEADEDGVGGIFHGGVGVGLGVKG